MPKETKFSRMYFLIRSHHLLVPTTKLHNKTLSLSLCAHLLLCFNNSQQEPTNQSTTHRLPFPSAQDFPQPTTSSKRTALVTVTNVGDQAAGTGPVGAGRCVAMATNGRARREKKDSLNYFSFHFHWKLLIISFVHPPPPNRSPLTLSTCNSSSVFHSTEQESGNERFCGSGSSTFQSARKDERC